MTFKTFFAASALSLTLGTAAFAGNPNVGGAAMLKERNIIENAVNSPVHETRVAAVKAADLVETFLKPANKAMVQNIPTAHVVAGDWSAADTGAAARTSSDGVYHFNAVSGDALSAQLKDSNVYIIDESGAANRVIHVVNAVLVPT